MKVTITVATIYLVVYLLALNLTGMSDLTFILFSFSPLPVILMVYKILKDDYKESKTFDSHFYADREDIERVKSKS